MSESCGKRYFEIVGSYWVFMCNSGGRYKDVVSSDDAAAPPAQKNKQRLFGRPPSQVKITKFELKDLFFKF